MILIDGLSELINNIPELIVLFLPGFIFMCIYMRLNSKRWDMFIICLWSLFTSYLIKTVYSLLHSVVFIEHDYSESLKVIVYVLTGAVLPGVLVYFKKSKLLNKILLKINYQTGHADIFDDVIDYRKLTLMTVYLKEANCHYIGTYSLREEKGKDSYIVLIDYSVMDDNTNEETYTPKHPSSVVINLNEVERIEITYSSDSETWEKLRRGNYS